MTSEVPVQGFRFAPPATDGVPAFYIEQLELQDAGGQPWWRIALHEPVSENPLITFELPTASPPAYRLVGRDNNGNRIDAWVTR